jgi:putative FmdB family regulatory protein
VPTYNYECNACGHAFELFQSMTAGVKRKCPECGKQKLQRLIGAGAGILFKGSGFYETDYRSSSYQKAAKSDGGPADAGAGSAGAGKSEAGKKASPGKKAKAGSSSGDS